MKQEGQLGGFSKARLLKGICMDKTYFGRFHPAEFRIFFSTYDFHISMNSLVFLFKDESHVGIVPWIRTLTTGEDDE